MIGGPGAWADDGRAGAAASAAAESADAAQPSDLAGLTRQVREWLEQRVQLELEMMVRAAQLTPSQRDQLQPVARQCLESLASDFVQQPQALLQEGALFVRTDGRFRKAAIEPLVTARVSAVAARPLNETQLAAYQEQVKRRTTFRTEANAAVMVMLLDRQLHLTPEQRGGVYRQLSQHWRDAPRYDMAAYLAHPRCFPTPLRTLLQDVLDAAQQPIWDTLPAADFWLTIGRDAQPHSPMSGDWLERNLLRPGSTADAFRQGLSTQLDALLQQVDSVCSLAEDQRSELRLAGRGDAKRFFDRVAAIRGRVDAEAADPSRWVRADHDRAMPLQQALSDGIYSDGSLFQKVLAARLSRQQSGLWQQAIEARAAAEHAAHARLLVANLDRQLAMLDHQRSQLLELLQQQTRPMPSDQQYAQYLLIYQAAAIPGERLRATLDDDQLAALDRVFRGNRGAEIFLRQNGLLPTAEFEDGEDD